MASIVEVQNLVKKYGDFAAVDGVSFAIEEGEIFSLLGPNGAGKTTTISVLSCLLKPTSGDAIIGGHSVARDSLKVREVIGVVPQDIALYNMLSARENLMFWGRMYGMGGAPLKQRVDEVLEQIGLTDKANAKVETYSGGMKRRVNIGVGLLHKPRIIYMDEPTVGIDPQSRRGILETVKDLNRQGMTVLYTTHYMEEAQELSDRVGIIDHRKLIALGTQKEDEDRGRVRHAAAAHRRRGRRGETGASAERHPRRAEVLGGPSAGGAGGERSGGSAGPGHYPRQRSRHSHPFGGHSRTEPGNGLFAVDGTSVEGLRKAEFGMRTAKRPDGDE